MMRRFKPGALVLMLGLAALLAVLAPEAPYRVVGAVADFLWSAWWFTPLMAVVVVLALLAHYRDAQRASQRPDRRARRWPR